ncbi:MAG TPA: hypothetical protein VF575_03675 [Candidatus Saccharimonadales bacterium]|jgi:ABC-type transport system involved in multi-copper enzyme maturation permease subunit
MKLTKKGLLIAYAIIFMAAIITGIVFYNAAIGDDSTNIFSVIFGWQWLYLAIFSFIILLGAALSKRKNSYTIPGVILISLTIVFLPARLVESSHLYVTGGAGPSGPHFACLTWKNSAINLRSGAYGDNLGLCTLMSIPSYNKFLIDRSIDADSTYATATASYYTMLAINQMIILVGGWFSYRTLSKSAGS